MKYDEVLEENLSLSAQLATEKLKISKLKSVHGFDSNNNTRFSTYLRLSNNMTIVNIPSCEIYTELKFEETPKPIKQNTLEDYFSLVVNI